MTLNLNLKKFKPSGMPDNATCILLGKRRTGKTTITLDIMYNKRFMPCGVVISGTEESNHTFKDIVPDTFIYGEYKPEILERVFVRQKKLTNHNQNKIDKGETSQLIDSKVFIILDDCMYDKSVWKSEVIRKVFFNGRHFNIFFMATCQYLMEIPPSIRANIDYTFVLREPVLSQRQKIYTYFAGIVPDFKMFCHILDNTTNNYECMVIDNTSRSTEICDILHWYRAKVRSKGWRIGSNSYWLHHRKKYNPKHDEDCTEEGKDGDLRAIASKHAGVVVRKSK
jgi:hypothetical protein